MQQPDHTGCMTLHSARQKPSGVIMEAAPLQICRLRLRLCVFFFTTALSLHPSLFFLLLSLSVRISDVVGSASRLTAQGRSESGRALNVERGRRK